MPGSVARGGLETGVARTVRTQLPKQWKPCCILCEIGMRAAVHRLTTIVRPGLTRRFIKGMRGAITSDGSPMTQLARICVSTSGLYDCWFAGIELLSVHFLLRGRRRRRETNPMFNRLAVSSVHFEAPNGRPVRNEPRTDINSASRCATHLGAPASAPVRLGRPSSHSENELNREENRSRNKELNHLSSNWFIC